MRTSAGMRLLVVGYFGGCAAVVALFLKFVIDALVAGGPILRQIGLIAIGGFVAVEAITFLTYLFWILKFIRE